jgi:O-6-methylguanine DNA methyltransferase
MGAGWVFLRERVGALGWTAGALGFLGVLLIARPGGGVDLPGVVLVGLTALLFTGYLTYGETISYEELAGRVGNPAASRAVGRANGTNQITIVIPCHRVVNKGGQLGGYGGGRRRKEFLLNLERSS